jgi:hypothetical protein
VDLINNIKEFEFIKDVLMILKSRETNTFLTCINDYFHVSWLRMRIEYPCRPTLNRPGKKYMHISISCHLISVRKINYELVIFSLEHV